MLKLRHFGWLIQMCLLIGLQIQMLKPIDLSLLMLKYFDLLILKLIGLLIQMLID